MTGKTISSFAKPAKQRFPPKGSRSFRDSKVCVQCQQASEAGDVGGASEVDYCPPMWQSVGSRQLNGTIGILSLQVRPMRISLLTLALLAGVSLFAGCQSDDKSNTSLPDVTWDRAVAAVTSGSTDSLICDFPSHRYANRLAADWAGTKGTSAQSGRALGTRCAELGQIGGT